MGKKILLVHGRHYKPPKSALKSFWLEALRHGLERDYPERLRAFDKAKFELVYYGDISNAYLSRVWGKAPPDDLVDRRLALENLKRFKRQQFNKTTYRKLPGYNPWMEGLADAFSGPLHYIGLSEPLIERIAPDMREYWDCYQYGSDVRSTLTDALVRAMKSDDEICVMGHSMGTIVAFDVLWKLSHTSEYKDKPWNRKIDLWITLGSPLADVTIRGNLKGAGFAEHEQYPKLVRNWLNISAEDDYIAHEPRVAREFKMMKKLGFVETIHDKHIYNLAVRRGKSNPHHGTGYLIHPVVADALSAWL